MRIAVTVDPYIAIPPRHYGGIERVVDFLVRGLLARGHEVTLFAHPDSRTESALVPYGAPPHVGRLSRAQELWQVGSELYRLRDGIDLVHSFSRLAALLPILPLRSIAKLQTYQRDVLPRKGIKRAVAFAGASLKFTACSTQMYSSQSFVGEWTTVFNGVDLDKYSFAPTVAPDAPLVFLGRVEHIKGTHNAIAIAKAARRRLLIAGNPRGRELRRGGRALRPRSASYDAPRRYRNMRLHEEQQEQGLEQEIVRLGARLFLGTARDEELLERLHGSPDASRLLHIASREGMTGILAAQLRRLARHKELELPLTHLSRALRGVFVHNGAHLAALFGLRQKLRRESVGSNLNVVSGLDSKSDVSVGMNPSTGPRTRLERAGPRSGPARSQTWRSGCRVPGHTPSVSTRGVGSADYPPVRIFAAIGTSRGELEERRSHKPGETFSRPNPTLSTPVFVNLRGASRDLPDQRSEFPMRGACRDPTQIHCVEHLASAG